MEWRSEGYDMDSLLRRLVARGWLPAPIGVRWGAGYLVSCRSFPTADVEAVLARSGFLAVTTLLAFVRSGTAEADGGGADEWPPTSALALGRVPPIAFSEAAGAVQSCLQHDSGDPVRRVGVHKQEDDGEVPQHWPGACA